MHCYQNSTKVRESCGGPNFLAEDLLTKGIYRATVSAESNGKRQTVYGPRWRFGTTDQPCLRRVGNDQHSHALAYPSRTPMIGKSTEGGPIMATRKIGRDAGTGEFIPVKEAERRPKTTTVETIKVPSPKKK